MKKILNWLERHHEKILMWFGGIVIILLLALLIFASIMTGIQELKKGDRFSADVSFFIAILIAGFIISLYFETAEAEKRDAYTKKKKIIKEA